MARKSSYLIYALRSPSGKAYVGLTSMPVTRRWSNHVMRAQRAERPSAHPLMAAIAKYGPENFEIEVLEEGLTREEAMAAEKAWIIREGSQAPGGYNVSPGGEADGATGAQRLRELLQDPEWREDYIAKLRAGIAGRPVRPDLIAKALEWRAGNPREAWKNSYRASRVALAGRTRKIEDPRFGPWGRLVIDSRKVAAARRSYFAKAIVGDVWARRSPEETASLGVKISRSLKKMHAANPEKIRATLAETRKQIDRKKQGPRASAGLKNWWAELRTDPERYQAYIQSRIDTKRKKREGKDLRHTERRAA